MDHEILKLVIFDQRETIRTFDIVGRDYNFDPNANYVVIGLRRAGKSTVLYSVVQNLVASGADWNQIIYVNFEDDRLEGFSLADFNDIVQVAAELSDKKSYFFFDEIQIIGGWEKFARRMADSKEHVFITGSNAKMLSSEIEERLGGRYLTKYVTPYNFAEFLTAKKISFDESAVIGTKSSGKIRRAFDEFFQFGGFPETLNLIDKREYVSSIYQKILLGDIASRNAIRNTQGLKLMMKKIAECVKDELSFSKIHNILKTIGVKLSKDSVIDYVGYAQDAFLIFAVRNYFSKFAEKESTPKYYFNDNGLLNLFIVDGKTRLLENFVALTLKNRYGEIYFLKSQKLDVDFFVPETGTVYQAAYSVKNISDMRETDSILKAAKTMDEAKNFVIVTYEEEAELNLDGVKIQVVPAWKWALEKYKV